MIVHQLDEQLQIWQIVELRSQLHVLKPFFSFVNLFTTVLWKIRVTINGDFWTETLASLFAVLYHYMYWDSQLKNRFWSVFGFVYVPKLPLPYKYVSKSACDLLTSQQSHGNTFLLPVQSSSCCLGQGSEEPSGFWWPLLCHPAAEGALRGRCLCSDHP